VNSGGFNLPTDMPNQIAPDKKLSILKEYFPRVKFIGYKKKDINSNDFILDDIRHILEKYIEEPQPDEFYLNIPKMAKNPLFKSLFPASVNQNEIDELNKMRASGKRPNIFEFFIKKEDKKFAEQLHVPQYRVEPGVTLTKQFFADLNKDYLCNYSRSFMDNNTFKDEFIWDFSEEALFHSDTSIYWSFHHYAHRNCALYLYGLDYFQFANNSDKWPCVNTKTGQKMPEYLSKEGDPSKGLAERYNNINAFNFIWGHSKWTETDGAKHLLERFGLSTELPISLKEIYHSFCKPILREIKSVSFDAFRNLGFDIIVNTLIRRTDLAVQHILQKNNQILKNLSPEKRDEFAEAWPVIWNEEIYETLENKSRTREDRYMPLKFSTFLERVSAYSNYKLVNIKNEIRKAQKENKLGPNDRGKIKAISEKIFSYIIDNNIIDEKLENHTAVLEWGNPYVKLQSLFEVMNQYEKIRNNFSEDWKEVKALHLKITTDELDREINKTENKKGKSISLSDTIKDITKSAMPNPEEELLDKEQKKEELKKYVENMKKLEPFRNRIIELFREEFLGENDWLSLIQEKSISELWDDMQDYPPRSFRRLKNATHSKLYQKYCEISNITEEFWGEYHTDFARKMRNIADILEAEGVKYNGR
jgi:hypothetical protein